MKRVLKWLKWLKVYSWENHRTKRCIAGFSQVHSWFCWWFMHFPNGKSTRNGESMVANPTFGEIALVWRGLEPICLSQFNHRRTCVWKMEVFFGGTWSRCYFVLGMTAMFFGPIFLSQEALQRGYHAGIFNGSEFLCTGDSWLCAVKLEYHLRIKYDIIWYSQKTKSFLFLRNDYI
jgi:hypothetical protein